MSQKSITRKSLGAKQMQAVEVTKSPIKAQAHITPSELFKLYPRACRAGQRFAMNFGTMAEAWEACDRMDWLVWAFIRFSLLSVQEKTSLLKTVMRELGAPNLALAYLAAATADMVDAKMCSRERLKHQAIVFKRFIPNPFK